MHVCGKFVTFLVSLKGVKSGGNLAVKLSRVGQRLNFTKNLRVAAWRNHSNLYIMSGNDEFHLESEALDEQLRRFEAAIDKTDPEQMQLLEQMKEHTRRLHQARGDWNKKSTFRNWNDPTSRAETTAPLAIESYR